MINPNNVVNLFTAGKSPRSYPLKDYYTALGLAGLALGLNVGGGDWSASAASRRVPPPPPEEKKDPGVNAITAKVLASKKRKEVLKDAIAKLKEQGKAVTKSSE